MQDSLRRNATISSNRNTTRVYLSSFIHFQGILQTASPSNSQSQTQAQAHSIQAPSTPPQQPQPASLTTPPPPRTFSIHSLINRTTNS